MTSGGPVSSSMRDKDLSASRAKRRVEPSSHQIQRQEAEQKKMHQRQQKSLIKRAHFLTRKSADNLRVAALQKSGHPREPVRLQSDVRIEKDENLARSEPGQRKARELLTAPTRRQLGCRFQAEPGITAHLSNDAARPIFRVIVENDQLEINIAARKD